MNHHVLAHNFYSDWSKGEIEKKLMFRGEDRKSNLTNYTILDVNQILDSVNWIEKGAIN